MKSQSSVTGKKPKKKVPQKKKKPTLSFVAGKVKGEIFYVHVQPENKKCAAAAADKMGISMSEWTDQLLSQVRTKQLI